MVNVTVDRTQLVSGFIAEPDGRGTFSILWSCLAVLFLNTWTVLHLNIPPPASSKWRMMLHKMKWWMICTTVPDGVVIGAYNQWRSARQSVMDMKKSYSWWTIAHGFYAEMGGFRVQDDLTGIRYSFRAAQLSWLAQENLITIPKVTKNDIHDRSTAGGLGKSIACAQSAWFLFQTTARIAQGLPITTLELATLPFIICTWLTYFFWWEKPIDMETFTTIHADHIPPEQLCRLMETTCFRGASCDWYRPSVKEAHPFKWDFFFWEKPWDLRKFAVEDVSHLLADEVYCQTMNTSAQAKAAEWHRESICETHTTEWEHRDFWYLWAIGTVFNGLPLAAWRFSFPSPIEAILWKAAVCNVLVVIIMWVPVAYSFSWLSPTSFAKNVPYYILTLVYAISRLYLVLEAFVGLRALPRGAFDTVNWTDYFPHIH